MAQKYSQTDGGTVSFSRKRRIEWCGQRRKRDLPLLALVEATADAITVFALQQTHSTLTIIPKGHISMR